VLKGLQWLHQGRDVLVLSTISEDVINGRAVSLLIEHHLKQICETLPPAQQPIVSRVAIQGKDNFNSGEDRFEWSDEDVRKVASNASDGKLFILYDEAR
jgi:hypothetical protein